MQLDDALTFVEQLRSSLVAAKDADARVTAASDRLSQLVTKTDAVNRQIAARHETLAELDALITKRQTEAAAARRTLDELREQVASTETRLKRMQTDVGRQLASQLG